MEPQTLDFLAESCGGSIANATGDLQIRRICSDSRAVREGDLFVALRGDRFDGHKFLKEVFDKGAAAAVVECGDLLQPLGAPGIVVTDCRAALGRIAARYRRTLTLPVIAVAGSNGKTSTKEIIASVLRQNRLVAANEASFNNDIGVPLTLLQVNQSHGAAVVEIGTNHPGEVAHLTQIVQPDFGVITSIGREHLEFFGDVAGVAEEEGALAELLPATGALFLNGDAPYAAEIAARALCRVVKCGLAPANDWRISQVQMSRDGTEFIVDGPNSQFCGKYQLPLLGSHQAVNALLAIALSESLGLDRGEVDEGLSLCRPAKMRMELRETAEFTLINDAYNANADSMIAALETLSAMSSPGRRVAILGDMAELGDSARDAHIEIGKRAAKENVELLIAIGEWSGVMVEAAGTGGPLESVAFSSFESAAPVLRQLLRAGDTILVKASRAARLERVVAALG